MHNRSSTVVDQHQAATDSDNLGTSPYLNVREASLYLRISVSKIYKEVSAKRLAHRKHGSRVVFLKEFLDDWSRSQEVAAAHSRRFSGLFGRV